MWFKPDSERGRCARIASVALTLVAVVVAAAGSPAAASHTTFVNNGPNVNRVNVIFLGDGYTASQVSTLYPQHVDAMYRHMFLDNEQPFARYSRFFNLHRIDVASNQSGADVAPQGIFRDTALDARYYYDGSTERLLYISDSKADAIVNSALAHSGFTPDMRFVTINDTRYGGGGGRYSTFAGGNQSAPEIALHEVAHSFSNLADEYGGFTTPYGGSEPSEVNVTKDPAGAKWAHWRGYNQPGVGVIGAYNGGRYYDSGIYRPSNNSKMRSLGRPFDAVSREKIILDIYDIIDPLDAWLPSIGTLTDPSLWINTIDENVIDVEWRVNGTLVPDARDDETFSLADFDFLPGLYTVTARAFDPTGFDPVNGWVRKEQHKLQQTITWAVLHTVPEPAAGAFLLFALLSVGRRR
jgi:hypothetical protein